MKCKEIIIYMQKLSMSYLKKATTQTQDFEKKKIFLL